MSKTCKVSILGYGMMGTVRSVAYEAVTRYYPNCPIKPVLHGAYTYTDGEFAAANEVGWKASKDLDAVIKDPECEYVDVCLPNSMHYDAVMKSIEAGKHVFCSAARRQRRRSARHDDRDREDEPSELRQLHLSPLPLQRPGA